ncbi:CehA/McbA family metallohydrolase [Phenylobacterium terrae]|uniref:CehA/McbA family metallohydrolase n=1 Tax=Phenylobacterium terrae TaxID=2665495 RepID=A0ABW4MZ73_9CAUL
MLRSAVRVFVGAVLAAALAAAAPARAEPDLTLRGTMTGADHQTYREVPFRVPRGVTRLTVEFEYTGREQRSVIDLGLRDPQRFRGWSGGNKAKFTLAETFATPSYLAGPLIPGEWRLILGVPNLRQGARADYVAKITFGREGDFKGFAEAPLRAGPGWFRGDLHLHTGHSDGACADRSGGRGPCPLHLTLEAAAARGLDFVAVTEHNATSHHQAMAELQPHFTDLLLIPGREITTFYGHANVFGSVEPLDFQLGGPRAPSLEAILDQAERAGAVVSINHPAMPSGEICTGCGWTAKTDYGRIQGVEVVNGGTLAQTGSDALFSGVPFWEARLDEGRRITALGGSDNHDAARPAGQASAVGVPTTVVWAENLSQPAILAGLRSGRVFVDVAGAKDRIIDLTAAADGRTTPMGGDLSAAAGELVTFEIAVKGAAGGRLVLAGPAASKLVGETGAALGADETRRLTWTSDGEPGWLRAEVRGPEGQLWLLGNPIYLNRKAPGPAR